MCTTLSLIKNVNLAVDKGSLVRSASNFLFLVFSSKELPYRITRLVS